MGDLFVEQALRNANHLWKPRKLIWPAIVAVSGMMSVFLCGLILFSVIDLRKDVSDIKTGVEGAVLTRYIFLCED